jgi:FkbM family methyltransferase
MKTLRGLFWKLALRSRNFRRRLAFQLKHHYPEDLDLRIPIGHGLSCPLFDQELAASFDEIFFRQEYGGLLEAIPMPKRWIDLGCYAGFFSLWLEWHRRSVGAPGGSEALMVDANASMRPSIGRLVEINGLERQWRFLCAAIAPGEGACEFIQRGYMDSSLASIDLKPGKTTSVPILSEPGIFAALEPPYDLLKVDMEGAEYELLRHYPGVLSQTRYLSLEWHSWHAGGGGEAQIRSLIEEAGFTLLRELQPARILPNGNRTGVLLYVNRNI